MSDLLSQAEIDELIRSMAAGGGAITAEPEAKKDEAKRYDFANPSKFSKEQLRALELIFDNFSRALATYLTGYLRTNIHIEVVGAEQVTYAEYSNSLANPVVLSIVEMQPLKGSATFELSANVGYAIIDRILGGPGLGLRKLRDFTEMEKILLDRVVSQMITFIPEAWQNVIALKPVVSDVETNTQFAQVIPPTEITGLVTMKIRMGSVEGFINFCIPHLVIEPIMNKINTRFWFSKREEENRGRSEVIEGELDKTSVPIRVILGRTTILVSDFNSLTVGDIIPLDAYINSEMDIMVGNLLTFKGKPGTVRGKNAVCITAKAEKEE